MASPPGPVSTARPQGQIPYEVYLNGVRVDDGGVGGTNTIAYCRDDGYFRDACVTAPS
ncbi:MAG TPA: hypothetical protein VGQ58_09230 [Candidatus Limnocylindrales bacterium]|nr:hypothetical protein [Candidatus Limnocylindrales bacterium]